MNNLLENAPLALRATKELLREVDDGELSPALRRYCENTIARIRVSAKARRACAPSWRNAHPPGKPLRPRSRAHEPPALTTLLVANRGEIACRVMRTAKAMGLTTVAVHSAIDRDARHSREADIRVNLGGTKAADSYLLVDKLLAAAKASGAQAIHPGYGFLSENAGFARAIEQAGLIFLGPPASAIDAMGSKSAAKALMEPGAPGARLPRRSPGPRHLPRRGQAHRLPGAAQSQRWRWGQGHEGGRGGKPAGRCPGVGPA